jgi:hypothetical protein
MDNQEKKPKKRGRKPKNKIIEKETKLKLTENLIIRLNNNEKEDITNILPYCEEELLKKINTEKNHKCSKVCWNCCHDFNDGVIGIPLKYINGVFYIYGYFCSLECGSRFALDNLKEHDFHEILSYINLFNQKVNNSEEKITIPPDKLVLEYFGGDKTIEEYRNSNKVNVYDIIMPPILPINHEIKSYETNSLNINKKSNLKLYRKNPLKNEKKTITNSMSLIIS